MRNDVEMLRAACCVAGLDGNVCVNERAILQELAEIAGVGQASLQAMINRAESDPEFYREIFKVVSVEPEEAMKILMRVAIADSELHVNERVVLHELSKRLGIAEDRFEELLVAAENAIGG